MIGSFRDASGRLSSCQTTHRGLITRILSLAHVLPLPASNLDSRLRRQTEIHPRKKPASGGIPVLTTEVVGVIPRTQRTNNNPQ